MNDEVKPNLYKPRWSKVFSDLWEDKARTALVVLSIAVGVFAVGMIVTAFVILGRDINLSYAAVNPPNIEVRTDPFYEDFVRVIQKVGGVEDVEGRRIINVRTRRIGEIWQNLVLVGITDFQGNINHLAIIEGTNIPGRNEVVVSQNFQDNTGYEVGDTIEMELPDGTTHYLVVVGIVTDQSAELDPTTGASAFIRMNSLRSYGAGNYFNRLVITVEGDGSDVDLIAKIAAEVEDKIKSNQKKVYRIDEKLSTEHPMIDTILAVVGVLGALGGLITILSSSLIINTLNALLTQQLRQIGVMKLVGGRSKQILGMYVVLIMIYGLIALILAVPLGALAGYALASVMAYLMGAVLQGFRFIPIAIIIQILIAILVPLGAGYVPINRGAKTNVRRAISNYRLDRQGKKNNILSQSFDLSWFSNISRPILLSLRNTFRKTGRLMLTVFTLTVAGAVFIAVFNVRDSMGEVVEQAMKHFSGDVTINFNKPYQVSKIKRNLMHIPGIEFVEGWGGTIGEIWDKNEDIVTNLSISAPPQDTVLLEPDFVAGRWLLPGEKNAIVISDSIYDFYPDLEIGDMLTIKILGIREEEWEVVGVFQFINMVGEPMGYANFEILSEKINLQNQASAYRVITKSHEQEVQNKLADRIDRYLIDRGYQVQSIQAGYILREGAATGANTLVIFLLIMAILTAIVGSIGLTGTMSINVLERTREIGVMRTIGAVDVVIMQSVVIEALVIGLITWVLAIIFSFPISSFLLIIIGNAMMGSTLAMSFTPIGILIWFFIIVVLSVIASIMPARNAARLTINEVLAYE